MPARNDEKAKELVGKKFGKLTVLKFIGRKGKASQKYYLCKCECGNTKEIYVGYFKQSDNISCGCQLQKFYEDNTINLEGKTFGILTVLHKAPIKTGSKTKDKERQANWICRCECGTIKPIASRDLRKGGIKSCGCQMFNRETKRKYTPFEASAANIFGKYNDGNITLKQFIELSQQNCHYCGKEPSNITNAYKNRKLLTDSEKESSIFRYNGLDRIDPSKPHNIDNCVPCCKQCNTAKLDYSEQEFKEWVKRIYHHYIKKT